MKKERLLFPITMKMAALNGALVLAALAMTGALFYQRLHANTVEPLIARQLAATAKGISLSLPADDLLELQKIVLENPILVSVRLQESERLKNLHRTLMAAKRKFELENDIRVFVRDPVSPRTLRLILSSQEAPAFGSAEPLDPYSEAVLKDRRARITPLFKAGGTDWLASLVPVENDKGELIAEVRVDARADRDIEAAMSELWTVLGLSALAALFLAASFAWLFARGFSSRLAELGRAAREAGKGSQTPRLPLASGDEIGELARSFAEMLRGIELRRERLADAKRDLERRLDARAAEVNEANARLAILVDSLDEGFFIFGRDGIVTPLSSRSCVDLLEGDPSGRPLEEVLRLGPGLLREWIDTVFTDEIPFSEISDVAPPVFPHSAGRAIALDYRLVRETSGKIKAVMVLARDQTARVTAEKTAAKERQFSSLILNIAENREQFVRFVRESEENLATAVEAARLSGVGARTAALQALHALQNGAGLFHLTELQHVAGGAESELTTTPEISGENLIQLLIRCKTSLLNTVAKFGKLLGANAFSVERASVAKAAAASPKPRAKKAPASRSRTQKNVLNSP